MACVEALTPIKTQKMKINVQFACTERETKGKNKTKHTLSNW